MNCLFPQPFRGLDRDLLALLPNNCLWTLAREWMLLLLMFALLMSSSSCTSWVPSIFRPPPSLLLILRAYVILLWLFLALVNKILTYFLSIGHTHSLPLIVPFISSLEALLRRLLLLWRSLTSSEITATLLTLLKLELRPSLTTYALLCFSSVDPDISLFHACTRTFGSLNLCFWIDMLTSILFLAISGIHVLPWR